MGTTALQQRLAFDEPIEGVCFRHYNTVADPGRVFASAVYRQYPSGHKRAIPRSHDCSASRFRNIVPWPRPTDTACRELNALSWSNRDRDITWRRAGPSTELSSHGVVSHVPASGFHRVLEPSSYRRGHRCGHSHTSRLFSSPAPNHYPWPLPLNFNVMRAGGRRNYAILVPTASSLLL